VPNGIGTKAFDTVACLGVELISAAILLWQSSNPDFESQ
jgi:hypothetical protein